MAVLQEKLGPGSCIIQEGEHYYSRDVVSVVAGADTTLPANTVLGMVTADGTFVQHDPAAADGSEDAAAILIYPVTGTENATVLKRHAQVKSEALAWIDGISAGDKGDAIDALAALGIIVR